MIFFSLSSGPSRRYSQARPFSIFSMSSTVFVFLSHVDPVGLSATTPRHIRHVFKFVGDKAIS